MMDGVRKDWKMPEKPASKCLDCEGTDIQPLAYWTGDGWELSWGCDLCGPDGLSDLGWEKTTIEWPFTDGMWGGADELAALGFTIV